MMIASAPRPPGGGLQHCAILARSASISLTAMVIRLPLDCPFTGFLGVFRGGSIACGSFAASGILLSSAASRSALTSRLVSAWGAGLGFGLSLGFSGFASAFLGR